MAKKLFSTLYSGLRARLNTQQEQPVTLPRSKMPTLKLMIFIVDWHRAHIISDVFVEEKVRFHFISRGMGTASSEILDLLGIGAGDKAVIFCLEQKVGISVLMKEVRKKFGFHSPGQGIAFTIPLSAINDPILLVFKQSIHKNEKIAAELGLKSLEARPRDAARPEGEGGDMAGGSSLNGIASDAIAHDHIVSIVNQGYSDEFMNTAREAGASGGTVINARGQAHEGAVKFFGISVQDEKEMILILTSRDKKVNIMRAVCEAHGLNSKAQGIVFSLPVDSVMGLSFE